MNKFKKLKKLMAIMLAIAMVIGYVPNTALAVTGTKVAKDGTYTGKSSVVNEYPDEDEWNDYGVTVELKVKGGKFEAVEVIPDSSFDSENQSYLNKAVNKSKGIQTLLVGESATEDTLNGWDTVSGATCSSKAVKEAALEAIHKAEEAPAESETPKEDETPAESETPKEDETPAESETPKKDEAPAESETPKEDETPAESETPKKDETPAESETPKEDETPAESETPKEDETPKEEVRYVIMNVPYTVFYAAYNPTDIAVWEVEEGVDAVSTATTSKFLSTTGLAKGTYNNGKYIMGVTIPVQVSAKDYEKLTTGLTENDNYYFVDLEEAPAVYSELTVNENSYSFSKFQKADVTIDGQAVSKVDLQGGYGDYQIALYGISPDGNVTVNGKDMNLTVYGAILDVDGETFGMTAMENLWFGTRVENMEIAWSIIGGQGLRRAHGSGDEYYQFDMNGGTLKSVTLITTSGLISIESDQELPKYYTGDLSELTYSITNDSKVLKISGIPEDLKDVTISVSGGLATKETIVNGEVELASEPEDGVKYTLTISSSNYPDITRSMSTPISEAQKERLAELIEKARATEEYENNTDLKEHVEEAEEMIENDKATSVDAATLINELVSKIKATYPTASATATLVGTELVITLEDVTLEKLEDPTYTLSYKEGRKSTVLTSGDLTSLEIKLDEEPTAGTEYTLTIVSENYQDIIAIVTAEEEKITWALMNIPYADFYKADVNNDVAVDAFSSATLNKTRTESLAGGSYHVNADGSDITGVTFPVKVDENVDLSKFKQVTDEDIVEITVTNRGQTSTTTFAGQEALFENESYAYYLLSEKPAYYKEVTVNEDGSLSFGKVVGEAQILSGVTAELTTETTYGDYQLDLDVPEVDLNSGKIYGVIVSTKEGNDYGMRHLENIWRGVELAWCTGFTKAVHNCPTSSGHYAAMMGQTINEITYFTSQGIYTIPVENIYVPIRFDGSVEVSDTDIDAGSTTVTVTGLPADYEAEYSIKDLDATVNDGVITFTNAKQGKYTLVVSDKSGKYAPMSTDFILKTKEMPAVYNGDDKAPALVAAEGFDADVFAGYLKSISSVSVNGESYSASGRGSVAIINNEDGTIDLNAKSGETAIFAENGAYEIVVSATGYYELTFIIKKTDDVVAPAEPTDPIDPIAPVEPTDPIAPAEPTAPADPVAPADPTESTEPGNKDVVTPGDNNQGGTGNNGTNNNNQNNTGNNNTNNSTNNGSKNPVSNSTSVKTGDTSNMYLWIVLLVISLTCGSYVVITGRHRKDI